MKASANSINSKAMKRKLCDISDKYPDDIAGNKIINEKLPKMSQSLQQFTDSTSMFEDLLVCTTSNGDPSRVEKLSESLYKNFEIDGYILIRNAIDLVIIEAARNTLKSNLDDVITSANPSEKRTGCTIDMHHGSIIKGQYIFLYSFKLILKNAVGKQVYVDEDKETPEALARKELWKGMHNHTHVKVTCCFVHINNG